MFVCVCVCVIIVFAIAYSKQSLYRQIADYGMGVGDHEVA